MEVVGRVLDPDTGQLSIGPVSSVVVISLTHNDIDQLRSVLDVLQMSMREAERSGRELSVADAPAVPSSGG